MCIRDRTSDLAAQIRQSHGQVQQLLSVLSAQAADLEEIYAKTSYRLAATKAYEAILMDRIASLQLSRLPGFQGVRGFLGRRMTPALDSCRKRMSQNFTIRKAGPGMMRHMPHFWHQPMEPRPHASPALSEKSDASCRHLLPAR